MTTLPGERRRSADDVSGNLDSENEVPAYSPFPEGWTFDVAQSGHLTSSEWRGASTEALVRELREKIRENRSRSRESPPPAPSYGDFLAHRMTANAAKPPKGLDPDRRAEWEFRKMSEAYARNRQAKAQARSKRWQILADLDAWTRVTVYLSTLVYRLRNDRHKAAQPQPDTEGLAAALAVYIARYLTKFLHDAGDHQQRLKGLHDFMFIQPARVPLLASYVAQASARDWDPKWIEEKIAAGKTSSSRGRTGTGTFATDAALDRLRELLAQRATHGEIAREFQVKPKTVQRAVRDLEQAENEMVRQPQEAAGAPSWWGSWERDDGILRSSAGPRRAPSSGGQT